MASFGGRVVALWGEQRCATYHRLSGAYRLTEDIRIRRRRAQLRPPTGRLPPTSFRAQYEVLDVSAGAPEKVTLGNEELSPLLARARGRFNLQSLELHAGVQLFAQANHRSDPDVPCPPPPDTETAGSTQAPVLYDARSSDRRRAAVEGRLLLAHHITGEPHAPAIDDLKVGPFLSVQMQRRHTQIFRVAKGEKFGVIYGAR